MTPGEHRVGTPVQQILATLRAEREGHVRLGGTISDRIRGELAGADINVRPERGTEPRRELPAGADGYALTGRTPARPRGAWFRRKGPDATA